MKTIGRESVVLFHSKIVYKTGGSKAVRDNSMIDASLNRAFASFDTVDLYPAVEDKIAAICHGLIKNHAFIDGNKRIGIAVMLLLIELNGIKIDYAQSELADLGRGVAEGIYDQSSVREWIYMHKDFS